MEKNIRRRRRRRRRTCRESTQQYILLLYTLLLFLYIYINVYNTRRARCIRVYIIFHRFHGDVHCGVLRPTLVYTGACFHRDRWCVCVGGEGYII